MEYFTVRIYCPVGGDSLNAAGAKIWTLVSGVDCPHYFTVLHGNCVRGIWVCVLREEGYYNVDV